MTMFSAPRLLGSVLQVVRARHACTAGCRVSRVAAAGDTANSSGTAAATRSAADEGRAIISRVLVVRPMATRNSTVVMPAPTAASVIATSGAPRCCHSRHMVRLYVEKTTVAASRSLSADHRDRSTR